MNVQAWQRTAALIALAGLANCATAAGNAPATPPPSPFAGDSTTPPVVTARLMLSAGIPEGFEEFHTPQKTLVDVYYGGTLLGTTAVRYTTDDIEFLQPDEIVNRIPNTVSKTALQQHLTGSIPRNNDLVCPSGQTTGCGKLAPDFIGVIFDESRFRVDVFVHPDMLFVQARDASRYLPPPNEPGRLTLVQGIGAVTSHSNIGPDAHTLNGNTWLARGTDRIYSEWYNTDTKAFAIDQLAWQRDAQDHAYTAGVFQVRTDGTLFAQSTLMAGGGMGRSLKLRNDVNTQDATRLLVFLDTRSAVTIHKDGRLVSSDSYDAGNQQLDTSALPQGAYNIEIRITDAGGVTRIINRFFVKTSQLAPMGEPQWYAEAGQVMEIDPDTTLPDDAGTPVVRGAWRTRADSMLGYGLAAAAVDTHTLAEGNLTWLHPQVTAIGGLMFSTQGDAGWATSDSFRWGEFSGAVNLRRVWAAEDDSTDYQLAGPSGMYRNLSLHYPVLDGQLTASADHSRSRFSESEIYSLRYSRHFTPESFPRFLFTSQLSNVDGDLVFQLGVDLSGISDHWNWRTNVGAQHKDPGNGPTETSGTLSAQLGWRDGDRWSEDVEASMRANVDDEATILGADAQFASDYGRLRGTYDEVHGDAFDSQYMSASYLASFVTGLGQSAFGGRQNGSSALVVDLRSAPDDAQFDLLVDGRKIAVRGGRRVPVLLQPYRTYDVQLVDRGLTFLYYDSTPRQVTLYPGSVVPLEFKVERVVIVFGRILHKQHVCSMTDEHCYNIVAPLRNARLAGIAGFSMTDDDGTFQAEMITGTQRLQATRGSIECDIPLPEPRAVNGMLSFGDLVCETNIMPEQLPERPLSIAPVAIAAPAPESAPQPSADVTPLLPVPPVAATPGRIVVSGRLQSQQHVCSQMDNTCHDIVLPMRNATVRSGLGETLTARDGTFRLEVTKDATQLDITRGDRACTVPLPELKIVDGAATVGDLRCTLEIVPEEIIDASKQSAPAGTATAMTAVPKQTARTARATRDTTRNSSARKSPTKKSAAKAPVETSQGNALRAVREQGSKTLPAAKTSSGKKTPTRNQKPVKSAGTGAKTNPVAPQPVSNKPVIAKPVAAKPAAAKTTAKPTAKPGANTKPKPKPVKPKPATAVPPSA